MKVPTRGDTPSKYTFNLKIFKLQSGGGNSSDKKSSSGPSSPTSNNSLTSKRSLWKSWKLTRENGNKNTTDNTTPCDTIKEATSENPFDCATDNNKRQQLEKTAEKEPLVATRNCHNTSAVHTPSATISNNDEFMCKFFFELTK